MRRLLPRALAAFTVAGGAAAAAAPQDGACSAARQALQARAEALGESVRVNCEAAATSTGHDARGRWQAEAPEVLRSGTARVLVQQACADCSAEAAAVREVAVPVRLTVRAPAWVATRWLGAGQVLADGDLRLQPLDWPAGMAPEMPASGAPTGRLRAAVRAGAPVRAADLLDPRQRAQGDAVTLVVRSAGVELQAPAVLAEASRVGEAARVQVKDRRTLVEGVLVDPDTVLVRR